jgi:hypothetical protein
MITCNDLEYKLTIKRLEAVIDIACETVNKIDKYTRDADLNNDGNKGALRDYLSELEMFLMNKKERNNK